MQLCATLAGIVQLGLISARQAGVVPRRLEPRRLDLLARQRRLDGRLVSGASAAPRPSPCADRSRRCRPIQDDWSGFRSGRRLSGRRSEKRPRTTGRSRTGSEYRSIVLAWTIRTQTNSSSRSRMIGSRRATSSSNSWQASHGMQRKTTISGLCVSLGDPDPFGQVVVDPVL